MPLVLKTERARNTLCALVAERTWGAWQQEQQEQQEQQKQQKQQKRQKQQASGVSLLSAYSLSRRCTMPG